MTLEHVALVWQSGVDFGLKAGLVTGLAVGLLLSWLWHYTRSRPR